MTQTLMAYSSALNNSGRSRDLSIQMRKIENGYIFTLNGEKEVPKQAGQEPFYDRWEHFNATFVYGNLEDGLKECAGFFAEMEKVLAYRVKSRVAQQTKKKRGRPRKVA